MVEKIPIHTGHVQVGPAVVVIITGGDAHRVSLAGDSSSFGHIGKRSIPVIPIKPVEKSGASFFQTGDLGPIAKEDVQKAVVVVIKNCNTAQHGIDDGLVRNSAVIQHETHATLNLPILETYG